MFHFTKCTKRSWSLFFSATERSRVLVGCSWVACERHGQGTHCNAFTNIANTHKKPLHLWLPKYTHANYGWQHVRSSVGIDGWLAGFFRFTLKTYVPHQLTDWLAGWNLSECDKQRSFLYPLITTTATTKRNTIVVISSFFLFLLSVLIIFSALLSNY